MLSWSLYDVESICWLATEAGLEAPVWCASEARRIL
jgi:hypothetical protein